MELEILQDLKNYFGDDYEEEQESTLLFCIKRSIKSFKNKRNYPSAYPQIMIEKDMTSIILVSWICLYIGP